MWQARNRVRAFDAIVAFGFTLAALAQPADALSTAAEAEGRAIREVATTIRQTEEHARGLTTQIDEILRNLPGWERRLGDLRSQATRVREARAALRTDTLNAERGERDAANALRTFPDLDRRLQRLDQTIERTARALQDLQSRVREPEPPRAEEGPASPQPGEKQPGQAQPAVEDLSGLWLAGDEEWQIKHNPKDGTITVLDPIKHLPGRYEEFVGTVKGGTLTATYRVTDPSVFNPDLPERVRQAHVKDNVTWTLKLELTKDGTLEGTKGKYRGSYDKKTLKITRVTPATKKVALMKKAAPPVLAEPTGPKPTVETKAPDAPLEKVPPAAPDAATLQELLRRAAELKARAQEALRAAEQSTHRREMLERSLTRHRRDREWAERSAASYERLVRELRETLNDLRLRSEDLARRREELRRDLLAEGRDPRDSLDYMFLEHELDRLYEREREVSYDLQRFEIEAQQARAQIAEAERAAVSFESESRQAEMWEEEDWSQYDRAQMEALEARRAAVKAQRAFEHARQASP